MYSDAVPEALRHIHPLLKRADELRTQEPVISYYCAYYAATVAIKKGYQKGADSDQFLVHLLDLLEVEKYKLLGSEGRKTEVQLEEEAKSTIIQFAMRIFLAADNEDREGRANAKTVRLFQVASQFMEVMRIFSGAADGAGLPEIEERLKYARWRAIEISKTLGENSLVKNHSVSENSALPSMSGNFSAKRPLDPMVEPVDSRLVQLKNNNSDSHLEPSKNQEVLSSWPSNTNYGNPYPPTTSSIDGHVKQNSNDLGTKDQTMSSKSTDNYDYNRFDSNPVAIVSERIVSQAPADESVMRDPEPLSLAEKHARFAISALLFEDVPNAILNLEKALSILRNTK